MKSFVHYLKEEAEDSSKLKHIHHAEDRPFLHGSEGFDHAHSALMKAHEHIKGGGHSSHLSMKYDGSPSIVFGHHPETGKFFVASKSAFNANPKINYTHQDIEKNHGHAPGLVEKLGAALNHLKKSAPKSGVYQGDMMHSHSDLEHNKDGSVSFTPNTIKYTAHGAEADKIKKSKVGVVVHTQYHGKDIKSMAADPHPDTHNFRHHDDVYMRTAEHNTKHTFYSEKDQDKFKDHLAAAKEIHDKNKNTMYKATAPHHGDANHLATYINHTVRTDETPSPEGLKNHIETKYNKLASKLKTPAAISKKQSEASVHTNHIDNHKKEYENLLKMHNHLQKAKNVLVDTLNQHHGGLSHHIGNKKTNPEGFVIHHNGEPTKLVDRAEFSKANLLKVRK